MERGILMSTPMVEAILDKRKTVTRRLTGLDEVNKNPDEWELIPFKHSNNEVYFRNKTKEIDWIIKSPYGLPKTNLYVRETWENHNGVVNFKAGGKGLLGDVWKPSIHLHKKHSRIWIREISTRVERLNDITESDALAEGIINARPFGFRYDLICQYETGVDAYMGLWEQLNGKESRELNPWCWRLEYEVLSTTGRPSYL